jgi:CBS domain-containing protein
MQAKDIMTAPVISVRPQTTIEEIAALLIERRISAVPVVDEDGRLAGIVSEGDLIRRPETQTERRSWISAFLGPERQASDFVKSHGRTAREVMTTDVVTVAPQAELSAIADLLERKQIKRVPVVEGGRVVGIVSRANLLHGLVARETSAPPTATDASIREGLQRQLSDLRWLDSRRVNIVVSGGVVHLWGSVRSEEERRALRVAAEQTPGVQRVEEHFSPDWFVG